MRIRAIHLVLATVCLSPSASAQWVQTNGPYGAVVNALDASETHVIAGTYSGVFLSTDQGLRWTHVDSGITSTPVYSVAVSGTHLLAGTYAGGVFASADGGRTWGSTGLTKASVHCLAVSGTSIFAGT